MSRFIVIREAGYAGGLGRLGYAKVSKETPKMFKVERESGEGIYTSQVSKDDVVFETGKEDLCKAMLKAAREAKIASQNAIRGIHDSYDARLDEILEKAKKYNEELKEVEGDEAQQGTD